MVYKGWSTKVGVMKRVGDCEQWCDGLRVSTSPSDLGEYVDAHLLGGCAVCWEWPGGLSLKGSAFSTIGPKTRHIIAFCGCITLYLHVRADFCSH